MSCKKLSINPQKMCTISQPTYLLAALLDSLFFLKFRLDIEKRQGAFSTQAKKVCCRFVTYNDFLSLSV